MNNKRLLSVLGLCRKAGKIKYGFDSVKNALIKNEVRLIVFASDISEKTKEKTERLAAAQNIKTVDAQFTMSELAHALGLEKNTAIAAICDKGFAKLFLSGTEEI